MGEGVTRNAVIGKVHRLKLSARAKPAIPLPVRAQPPGPRRGASPARLRVWARWVRRAPPSCARPRPVRRP
ncbi:GcrA family cell cycle regulator [Paracoccus sp. (in: a-proteobacteria)]|uniref:GcrA family cell cycle regulator n=1 Tax=Paracoccus sp. TaxID=267 RepID=UPI002AFE8D6C|nr:GcrA family cell cycle regulator [Paracoccus sp. (in: a-proteobacteria)]